MNPKSNPPPDLDFFREPNLVRKGLVYLGVVNGAILLTAANTLLDNLQHPLLDEIVHITIASCFSFALASYGYMATLGWEIAIEATAHSRQKLSAKSHKFFWNFWSINAITVSIISFVILMYVIVSIPAILLKAVS